MKQILFSILLMSPTLFANEKMFYVACEGDANQALRAWINPQSHSGFAYLQFGKLSEGDENQHLTLEKKLTNSIRYQVINKKAKFRITISMAAVYEEKNFFEVKINVLPDTKTTTKLKCKSRMYPQSMKNQVFYSTHKVAIFPDLSVSTQKRKFKLIGDSLQGTHVMAITSVPTEVEILFPKKELMAPAYQTSLLDYGVFSCAKKSLSTTKLKLLASKRKGVNRVPHGQCYKELKTPTAKSLIGLYLEPAGGVIHTGLWTPDKPNPVRFYVTDQDIALPNNHVTNTNFKLIHGDCIIKPYGSGSFRITIKSSKSCKFSYDYFKRENGKRVDVIRDFYLHKVKL